MSKQNFASPTDAVGRSGLAARLLEVIENDIIPKTQKGVMRGDKVFGAAVLRKDDGALVVADTNREHSSGCPLWHGEMVALREFFAYQNHPPSDDCILLSTHEPCSMCASAIAWSGIRQVFFLFDYTDTEEQFAIPHDISILRALFAPASGLAQDNAYFSATAIRTLGADEFQLARIGREYDKLSEIYQRNKATGGVIVLK